MEAAEATPTERRSFIEEENEHDLHFSDIHTPDDEEPAAIPVPDAPPYLITRGKFKGLLLPRMIGVKPSKLQQVEALREAILKDPAFKANASAVAQTYAMLRMEAEEKQAELDEIKTRLTAVMLIMNEQYEAEDVLSLKINGVGTIRVQPEPHAIVLDKTRHQAWSRSNGYEEMMTLPWGTTNRLTKELVVTGKPAPDGVEAFMRPKVVFTEEPGRKAARIEERKRRLGIE